MHEASDNGHCHTGGAKSPGTSCALGAPAHLTRDIRGSGPTSPRQSMRLWHMRMTEREHRYYEYRPDEQDHRETSNEKTYRMILRS